MSRLSQTATVDAANDPGADDDNSHQVFPEPSPGSSPPGERRVHKPIPPHARSTAKSFDATTGGGVSSSTDHCDP